MSWTAAVSPVSPTTYADPAGRWSSRNCAVASADVQIDSSGTSMPLPRSSRTRRSRGVKIELFVSTRNGMSAARSAAMNSFAPGIGSSSRTRTPSMSVSHVRTGRGSLTRPSSTMRPPGTPSGQGGASVGEGVPRPRVAGLRVPVVRHVLALPRQTEDVVDDADVPAVRAVELQRGVERVGREVVVLEQVVVRHAELLVHHEVPGATAADVGDAVVVLVGVGVQLAPDGGVLERAVAQDAQARRVLAIALDEGPLDGAGVVALAAGEAAVQVGPLDHVVRGADGAEVAVGRRVDLRGRRMYTKR